MAKAMPPPAQVDQVDPITGQPLYTPAPTPAAPPTTPITPAAPAAPPTGTSGPFAVPGAPTSTPAVPQPTGGAQAPGVPIPAAATASNPFAPQPAQAAPSESSVTHAQPGTGRRGCKTRTPRVSRPASPATSAGGSPTSTWGRLTAPVPPQRSRWHLLLGAVLASAGFCTTTAFIVPVVTPERDWVIASGAAVALLVGVVLLRSGWHRGSNRVRVGAAALTALTMAGFVSGAVADPIVLDGKVLVETSTRAKSVRLADSIYDDLNHIAGYDDMLVAPIEDARAHVSEYEPATKDLLRISQRYAGMKEGDLPDPAFANVVAQMKTTAFWAAEAMETKSGLIEQEDDRAQQDLATQRASFTDNWLAAAASLKEVASGLDIPYTTDMEGPHE